MFQISDQNCDLILKMVTFFFSEFIEKIQTPQYFSLVAELLFCTKQ